MHVTTDAGSPIEGATVSATAGGVAAAASGYETTLMFVSAANMKNIAKRNPKGSIGNIAIAMKKFFCSVQDAIGSCTGKAFAEGFVSAISGQACLASNLSDELAQGVFHCQAGPNLHGDSIVAQALVLNFGSISEQLLSKIPLVGRCSHHRRRVELKASIGIIALSVATGCGGSATSPTPSTRTVPVAFPGNTLIGSFSVTFQNRTIRTPGIYGFELAPATYQMTGTINSLGVAGAPLPSHLHRG